VRNLGDIIDNPAGLTPAKVAKAEAAPAPSPPDPLAQTLDTSTVKLTANLSEDKVAMQQRSIGQL